MSRRIINSNFDGVFFFSYIGLHGRVSVFINAFTNNHLVTLMSFKGPLVAAAKILDACPL